MEQEERILEIVDVALPDGFGVARCDGPVVFVPGAVEGDLVRVRMTKRKARFLFAGIIEVLRPSPHRAEPFCAHFGACGGCSLQHVSYEAQLRIKENHLRQSLVRIGGFDLRDLPIDPIVPAPEARGGRNKIELSFGRGRDGLFLGLRERVSPGLRTQGRVVSLSVCDAFSGKLAQILPLARDFFARTGLPPFDASTRRGFLKHFTLRESKTDGDMMAILETAPGPLPDLSGLWQALTFPRTPVTSLYRAVSGGPVDTGLYDREELLFGAPSIAESVSGLRFDIFPGSFFQSHTQMARLLYQEAVRVCRPEKAERVLGLYSGIGPLELILSRHVAEVTGVDANPANISNARHNCVHNRITNCAFLPVKVEGLEKRLVSKPDVLMIDPPRGGMSSEAMRLVLSLRVRKFIYISCNPATLARDMAILRKGGYRPHTLIPFDAFPHTSHLETLVSLETGSAL